MTEFWLIPAIIAAFAGVSLVLSTIVVAPLVLLRRLRLAYRLCVASAAGLLILGMVLGVLTILEAYPISAAKTWFQAVGSTSMALGPGVVGWVLEQRARRV